MQKNENRPGYKKTKVGWIPGGWDAATLGSVTSRIGDGIHTTPEYVENSRYFFVNGNNLTDGRVVIFPETKCVSEDEHLKHKKDLGSSTLLLSINGTVGNVAYYRDEPVILGKSAAYINCATSLSKHFAFAFLSSSKAHAFFRGEWTGSTIMNLSLASLRQMHIPLPSLPEQEAIAEVLECWDKAIRNYEKKIERKRNIKKGLMQRLLAGKQRLPGFSEKWKKVRLKTVGKIVSGGTPSTEIPSYWNGSIPWCTPTEIVKLHGKFIHSTERYITDMGLRESSANLLPEKSLIVCTRATVGDCAINSVPMATNQGFKSIIPNSENDVEFIYYKICCMKNHFIRYASGSTFLEISKRDFEKSKLSTPVIAEQRAIATVLSSADIEIAALERKLAVLQDQKRYLLNNLVTGTIRLPKFVKGKEGTNKGRPYGKDGA